MWRIDIEPETGKAYQTWLGEGYNPNDVPYFVKVRIGEELLAQYAEIHDLQRYRSLEKKVKKYLIRIHDDEIITDGSFERMFEEFKELKELQCLNSSKK